MTIAKPTPFVIAFLAFMCSAAHASTNDDAEHFGISIGAPVHNGQVTFTEQVAQDLQDMGIRWIRVEFIAAGDTINYTQYDEIINRANAYDLKVLGLLTYQTKWYGGNSSNWAADWWQDDFRDRCLEIVNHYKNFPSGGIKFWEIWNEPDSLGYMPAEKFGRLLSVCYPAIKQADPQATIVLGGLTGFWTPTYGYMKAVYDSSYFVDYHAAHGIYPFDIMGQHPYDWTSDPEWYLDRFINGFYGMRRLMTLYGDEYKRIWFTEYGWNSSPWANSSCNPGGDFEYNQWLQGDLFTRGFSITQVLDYDDGFGPYAEKTFLFQYKDFELGTLETTEYFGTVNQQNERKHLFHRVKEMTHGALQNAALTATVTASDEIAPGEVAAFACDGTPFTKWTALSPLDDHTLTLDLNGWYEIHEFRLAHAEMGHEPHYFNTRAFEIQTAPTATGPWTTRASVSNPDNAPVNRVSLPEPLTARHVRLWITDASEADGYARLPEFEVLGLPIADAGAVAVVGELAASLGELVAPAASDLIAGKAGAFESGDIDPSHGVQAFRLASDDCLTPLSTPLTGFWDGYSDPSPATHLPAFTDGVGDSGVVLTDFARAAAVLRYDFDQPTDIRSLAVFSYNPAADGRVFQHYDVFVSHDFGASYEILKTGVKTGEFGDTNAGAFTAARTELSRPATGTLVEAATNLRFVFYATHIGNRFSDPWQGNFNESNDCDTFEPADSDGFTKAFAAPIITEIDVFPRDVGDQDSDGVVSAADALGIVDQLTGVDTGPVTPLTRVFDSAPKDDDIDLADLASVQAAVSE